MFSNEKAITFEPNKIETSSLWHFEANGLAVRFRVEPKPLLIGFGSGLTGFRGTGDITTSGLGRLAGGAALMQSQGPAVRN